MRRAAKVDANHAAIVQAFRQCGAQVLSLARMGDGCPDLFVTVGPRFSFVEVKTATGKMNPDQVAFARRWPVRIVRTIEEAAQMVRALRSQQP